MTFETTSILSQIQHHFVTSWENFVSTIPPNDLAALTTDFKYTARPNQKVPPQDWLIWLLLGGRGCGKTRTGAEWISKQARKTGRIALVAPTLNDAREVMLEGESGLLNIDLPMARPSFVSSRRRLEWPNGAVAYLFSAEDPDSLRGPQFGAAWADEFCAWRYPDAALSNLRLGLRLGQSPQLVMTTTPRPIPALLNLMQMNGLVVRQAKTAENVNHLAPAFLAAMDDSYGGTRLGRQELNGEIIKERRDALWSHEVMERCRLTSVPPEMDSIIIAVDPPVTSGVRSDKCGLIVAGRAGQGRLAKAYLLQDATVQGLSPERWAQKAVLLYHQWDADGLVVEVNQGGDMVQTIIRAIEPSIPIRTVFATKSKKTRAEPVAALYEQGRVLHTARCDDLEDELLALGTPEQKHSPDRADALVWAVSHLLIRSETSPQIRAV
jgi:phage terminase large subunit-like protein